MKQELQMNETQTNNLWDKFMNKMFNNHNYSTRRKIYNSMWSILLGLFITILIISFFGYNPFSVIVSFFQDANVSNIFIPTLVTFILAGLAIAVCFKAGIFNIGVAGQMMSAGFITLVLIRKDLATMTQTTHATVALSILLSIVISIAVSMIIGVLKAYLNVNEVVSSIMVNWIVFFVIRYIVGLYQDPSLTNGFNLTTGELMGYGKTEGYIQFNQVPEFYFIDIWFKSGWSWLLIIGAILITIVIWVTIRFTKFGYKIQMVGLSSTAADYSGTNKKHLILSSMAISGALSGLAGFVWYFSVQQGVIDISISSGPLYIGFNAIAISLIVFDNPIAIIFSSFVFSLISVGSQTATSFPALPNEMTDIISGIFIYSAALAFVFSKFVPYQWTKNFIILIKYPEYRKVYWRNWKEHFVYFTSAWFNEKKELWNLWKSNHGIWRDIKKQMNKKQKEEEKLLAQPNTKIIFKNLDKQKQIEYLELLSKLKKEKDILLAEEHYFDKYQIKAKRKDKLQSWNQQFNSLKTKLIQKHYKVVQEKLVDSTKELAIKEKEQRDKDIKGGK